jgi:hypothetical protein
MPPKAGKELEKEKSTLNQQNASTGQQSQSGS